MNVKRQYSLPNCTLTLEGLSDMGAPNSSDSRPVLSILTYARCQFVGSRQSLHGGRAFLENLVAAVSAYAQECLSGVHHPVAMAHPEDQIQLESADKEVHRLIWHPSPEAQEPETPVIFPLSTVQLFDLVEAIDQFMGDSKTLPDLNLNLKPVSRRYRQGDEPLGKKAFPLALGLASLALSAAVLCLLPLPEVRKPEPKPAATPSQSVPSPLK
jgi:hypothetical protein